MSTPRQQDFRWLWGRGVAAALLGLAGAACNANDGPTLEVWVERSRQAIEAAHPDSEDMQIDPSATCRLVDGIEVAGKPLELFGAGVALFGDIGSRYQCAWSGDVSASANVRLEVVLVDSPVDYLDYAELVPTRDGNKTAATDVGDVEVASFTPDGAVRPVTTAVLLLPDQQAGVHLVVELLDTDAASTWGPNDYAQLLEELAA